MFDAMLDGSGGHDEPFDAAALGDDELMSLAVSIERHRTALDLRQAQVLAQLDTRGVCDRTGMLPTGAWLAHHAALPVGVARTRVRVARMLVAHLDQVAAALADGRLTWEHARVIVELANPRIVELVVANQDIFIGLAARCRFDQWSRDVRELARRWDQDGGYDPNEDPNRNRLTFGTTLDGLVSLAATLTGEHGQVVTQAIDAKADELHRRAVQDHKTCPDLQVPSRANLRALALTELIRQALGTDLHSTKGPTVEATIVIEADDPTHATNPDGVALADGTVRVLACGAQLGALVVDRDGVPLDLGRSARLASAGQRRAVRRRDGGCVVPGCTAKGHWCDVHHCVHWDDDGVTDLCNLVCLCRYHHGVIHRRGWSVRIHHDGWAIITSPSGSFWGQRHGRQRQGPLPPTADPPTHDHRAA